MIIKIKRQENENTNPYWQNFKYEGKGKQSVSTILETLNFRDDLFDAEGNEARRIRWNYGCLQKLCGACGMLINSKPALACNTFIDVEKEEMLVLAPLKKFPVISDLVVDRSIIHEHAKKAELYLGKFKGDSVKNHRHLYEAAKCLKCGLCLEACPNYISGKRFLGAAGVNEMYLLYTLSEDRRKILRKSYVKYFENGCSKDLSCMDICPMKLPTLSSIGKMNRGF